MVKNFSCYIDGLITMAISFSHKIGHSGIDVVCFLNKNFDSEFSKYYEISLNSFKFIKENQSLKEVFSLYFEDDIVDKLLYLIESDLGKEIKMFTINDKKLLDKLSCFNGGKVPFYFIENVYIAFYKEYVLCFVFGNNE